MSVTLNERYMVPVHIYPGTLAWAIDRLAEQGEPVRGYFKAYVAAVLGMHQWHMTEDALKQVTAMGQHCTLSGDEISMCIDEIDHSLVTDMVDYIQQVWAIILPQITKEAKS